MGQDNDAALDLVRATSVPIHDIGTAAYLSPDIAGWAAEWGWSNPFAFYFAGRGGMLGDVGAEVVTSTLGWFAPGAVQAMYNEGIGVAPAEGEARSSVVPAEFGGNMDSPEASVGNTVYFPVNVKGGLFYIGDGHAAMGDGEIAGDRFAG